MEELKNKTEKISSQAKEYLDTLFKFASAKSTLKIVQKSSVLITGLILVFFSILSVIFLSFALGLWLGELMKSNVYGFLIVGILYFLLVCVLLIFRKKTILPFIRNIIVKILYD